MTEERIPRQREDVPECLLPLIPPDVADRAALWACEQGRATAEQQQRALKCIVTSFCGAFDHTYYRDPYDHACAAGRRSVGLHIISAIRAAETAVNIKEQPQ